jgi:hypothetical protein
LRRLLLLFTAIAILTACSDEISDYYPASDTPISYNVSIATQTQSRADFTLPLVGTDGDTLYAHFTEIPTEQTITRGMPVTKLDSTSGNILVSAYYYPTDKSKDTVTVFKNEQLLASSKYTTFGSANKYYWPQSGYMDFYAVYPESSLLTNNKNLITYTTPQDASKQLDILATSALQQDENKILDLTFAHACSRLVFKLDSLLPAGIVQKITINGVKTAGTYDIDKKTWTLKADTATIIADNLAKPTKKATGESSTYDSTANTDEKTFILIPQTLSNAEVTIEFDNYKLSTDTDGSVKDYTITVGDKFTTNLTDKTLVAGKSYYVTISKTTTADATTNSTINYEQFDSYNFIKKYTFKLESTTTSWQITSNQDWLTFTTSPGYYCGYGFWVDEEKGAYTVSGTVTPGDNNTVTVYTYCTENTSTSDRYATIMLVEDNALTGCKFMQQLGLKTYTYSSGSLYTSNSDYCNIETGAAEKSQWGFYTDWCTLKFKVTKDLYDQITKIISDKTYETSSGNTTTITNAYETNSLVTQDSSDDVYTVSVNFGNLQKVVSTNEGDGEKSTKNLFFHTNSTYTTAGTDGNGLMSMLQIAFALMRSDKATLTSGDINTVMQSAIVRAAQYNQFSLTTNLGESVPTISSITWYLPGKNQINSSQLTSGRTYWSSTGYSSGTTYGAYSYTPTTSSTSTATASRDNTYYIHAVRATTGVTK